MLRLECASGSPHDDNIHAIYQDFARIETKKANLLFLKQAKAAPIWDERHRMQFCLMPSSFCEMNGQIARRFNSKNLSAGHVSRKFRPMIPFGGAMTFGWDMFPV
jgi:hypothetical protein